MIIASGFRSWVGADYPVYAKLFSAFSIYVNYEDVFDKAFFLENRLEMEWIYTLINKVILDLGFPFYLVTFIIAALAISLKVKTMVDYSAIVFFSILYYFTQLYFFEDCGQMRQGIGSAICFYSFRYITKRKLFPFIVCIFIALGFHKTAIVFIPAYWLATIPMNSKRIFWAVAISILLSPFEVYRLAGGLITSIMPQDISMGYTGYVDDTHYGTARASSTMDIVNIIIITIMIIYDKRACKVVPYYEYMRNLAIFGLCMSYIFRMNFIFSLRLPGVYITFLILCVPNIIYSIPGLNRKTVMYGFLSFFIVLFFYFGKVTAGRANFTYGKYQNILW